MAIVLNRKLMRRDDSYFRNNKEKLKHLSVVSCNLHLVAKYFIPWMKVKIGNHKFTADLQTAVGSAENQINQFTQIQNIKDSTKKANDEEALEAGKRRNLQEKLSRRKKGKE